MPGEDDLQAKQDTGGNNDGNAGDSAADDAEWNDSAAAVDPLADLQLAYRPTWNLQHNAVTTYHCVPISIGGDGSRRVRKIQVAGREATDVLARLDGLVVERAANDLRQLLAANLRLLVTIPVHFETLATANRRATYLARFRALVRPEAAKLMALQLVGVPDGVPAQRLREATVPLKPYARALLLSLLTSGSPPPPLREAGIAAVGYECRSEIGPEGPEMRDMERLAAVAQRAGVGSFVFGVRSLSLASASIAAGIGFVNGDAIAPLVDAPREVYSFDVAALYAKRLRDS